MQNGTGPKHGAAKLASYNIVIAVSEPGSLGTRLRYNCMHMRYLVLAVKYEARH